MVVLREVATVVSILKEIVIVELCRQMIPESLDGLDDWSHCWLVCLNADQSLQVHAFSIDRIDGKRLCLRSLTSSGDNVPLLGTIVDIKPVHHCDQTSS